MYQIRPLGSFIVVRVEDAAAEKTTPGGIIIPDKAKERPAQGEVLSVGPGAYGLLNGERVNPQVEVGDKVLFLKHALIDIPLPDGTKVHAVTESDIIGIVEETVEDATLTLELREAA